MSTAKISHQREQMVRVLGDSARAVLVSVYSANQRFGAGELVRLEIDGCWPLVEVVSRDTDGTLVVRPASGYREGT